MNETHLAPRNPEPGTQHLPPLPMLTLRPFGSTGLFVTPIGLGLAALGRPGYITLDHAADLSRNYEPAAMQAHAHTVLDAAWAAGIRYFDAARSYGQAEAFLGLWLHKRGIAADAVITGSKWGYTYTAGWQVEAEKHEIKEHSLAVLQRQIGESRERLGLHLKLYQIHSATLDSGALTNANVLAELARLRDEGLCIGLSLSGPDQAVTLRQAMTIRMGGAPLFGAVQATWNLLEPSAGPALAEAAAAGMGVIVKEALANARLTDRNPDFAAAVRSLTSAGGLTPDALALAAALAQPWAHVVLSGAARVDHLNSNLAALGVRWDEAWSRELASLVEAPQVYWLRRSRMPWN